jgi:cytochrome P450
MSSQLTVHSLRETQDKPPFEADEELRKEGGITWDQELQSWLLSSYEACREVARLDKTTFRHTDFEPDSSFAEIAQQRRSIKSLEGEEHRSVHGWTVRSFTPSKTSELRDAIVEPVVQSMLDRISARGHLELTSEYLDLIPSRVICSALELPWDDPEWMAEAAECVRTLFEFYNVRDYGDRGVVERAKAAHLRMRGILDLFMQERHSGDGDDLLSLLWRDGPEMLPDWDIEDVFIQLMSLFLGGSHSSTLALSNSFYLLLTDQALKEQVLAGGRDTIAKFVEQSLRLYPPLHFRTRLAREDVTIAGTEIKKGQQVVPVLASANRDEAHYRCPHAVDLEQKVGRDHLTFFAGPTACPGQGLARMELLVAISETFARLPDLRLDPNATPPDFPGLALRAYRPLNVLYTPA